MKKFTLTLVAILAAAFVSACGPSLREGQKVLVADQARGCRTYADFINSWWDCNPTWGETKGVVESHPNLGPEYMGRVRVRLDGGRIAWFMPGDLTTVP